MNWNNRQRQKDRFLRARNCAIEAQTRKRKLYFGIQVQRMREGVVGPDKIVHDFSLHQTPHTAQKIIELTNPLKQSQHLTPSHIDNLLHVIQTLLTNDCCPSMRLYILQMLTNLTVIPYVIFSPELLHILFKHPLLAEEYCDAIMLINNIYERMPSLHPIFIAILTKIALVNTFACDVLISKHPSFFYNLVVQHRAPHMVACLVIHSKNYKTLSRGLDFVKQMVEEKTDSLCVSKMLQAILETDRNIVLDNFFLMLQKGFFLQHEIVMQTVTFSLRKSRDIGFRVANLLSECAIVSKNDCFRQFACNKEAMHGLQDSLEFCDVSIRGQILEQLYFFWFNMFFMCTEATIHEHFYIYALREYKDMAYNNQEVQKVTFFF